MNKSARYLLTFIAGVAAGSVATFYFVKDKYEKIAQEEIDSVKEVFSKRAESLIEKEKQDNPEPVKEEKPSSKYVRMVEGTGYFDYSTTAKRVDTKEEHLISEDKPYVISPDEYGELDGYETISLTYYANGVVTDDLDEPLDDIDRIIGFDSLLTYGEYEKDAVYIRNDTLKCDYEVLRVNEDYDESEIV